MDPATAGLLAAILPTIIGGGATIGASLFNQPNKPLLTPEQQALQRQIQEGISGGGPLGFLNPENAIADFDKLVGDPALEQFQNLTVPQIQERFVGQLRGTPAQDAITRSGADLSGKLSQQKFQQMQNAMDRAIRAATGVVGTKEQAVSTEPSPIEQILSDVGKSTIGGEGEGISNAINEILNYFSTQNIEGSSSYGGGGVVG